MRHLLTRIRRPLRLASIFLGLGLIVTLAVTWILAAMVDVMEGRQSAADSFDENGHWTLTRWDRAGATLISSVRIRGGLNWSTGQATGAPDTPSIGDQVTAWASASSDGSPEWLELRYNKAVIPRVVLVYESYSPGALYKVSVFDKEGTEHVAWTGVDPAVPPVPAPVTTQPATNIAPLPGSPLSVYTLVEAPAPASVPPTGAASGAPAPPLTTTGGVPIARIPISLNIPSKRIKIYLASDKVPGWNEIDAVGLLDDQNQLQWASGATASSTYASNSSGAASPGSNPILLIPSWCALDAPSPGFRESQAAREDRLIDARGWPMLAMASERDGTQPGATPPINLTSSSSSVRTAFIPAQSGSGTTAPPMRAPMPLRPIWLGLLGNSAFYGVILAISWLGLIVPRKFFREVSRFRSGCCIQCGYDVGYDFLKGCPECGWRRERMGEK